MAKLSMYSACQVDECRCTGWKTPDENRKGDVENNYIPKFTEECRNQSRRHSLEQHISHLSDVTDEQTYELLGAVVDVENLYMSMHNEKDDDTKKVYYFLFRVSLSYNLDVYDELTNNFLISAFAAMHINAYATNYNRPIGRSTI